MSGEQPLSNLNATTVCALASFAKRNDLGNSPDCYCCILWRLSVGLMGSSVIENLNLNLALHKECCEAIVASAAIHLHSFVVKHWGVDKVNSIHTLLPLLGLCLYLCSSTDSNHTHMQLCADDYKFTFHRGEANQNTWRVLLYAYVPMLVHLYVCMYIEIVWNRETKPKNIVLN